MKWILFTLFGCCLAGNLYSQDITYTHENVLVCIPSITYNDRRADIQAEREWRREQMEAENKTKVEVSYNQKIQPVFVVPQPTK